MGLRSRVQKSVKKAFKQIGDLKTVGVLAFFNQSSYDFATQSVVETQPVTQTVGGFMLAKADVSRKTTKRFLFDSTEVKLAAPYDKLTIGAETYKIVPPIVDDGFLTTLFCVEA
jgi:hypothetical protein